MTNQRHTMHDPNTHEAHEHRQWIELLEGWQIEHKHALAKLTKMQAAILEHDAEIAAQLAQIRRHEQFIAHENKHGARASNGNAEHAEANPFGDARQHYDDHRELRAAIKEAESTHQRSQEALQKTIKTMREIRANTFREDPNRPVPADDAEVIYQAGVESFPASDPPSFNPTWI